MLLSLDTSNNQKTIVGLDDSQLAKSYSRPRQQRILEVIDELLKEKKITPQKIKEIQINPGPGAYTSLRVGCAVANTMAWALGIKVNQQKQVEPIYG